MYIHYLCIAPCWFWKCLEKMIKRREETDRILLSIHHFQFKSFINGNLKPPQWCSLFMLINNFKSFSGCTNILYIMSTTNWLIPNWMVNETIYCNKIEIECSHCCVRGRATSMRVHFPLVKHNDGKWKENNHSENVTLCFGYEHPLSFSRSLPPHLYAGSQYRKISECLET